MSGWREGKAGDALGLMERDFIARRDSFYLATVTADGWPYVQHRGGPKGFLRVLDDRTLAFADFAGNAQYVSVGNLETNDRVTLFLMDYPNQARLKVIGHTRVAEGDAEVEAKVAVPGYAAKVQRVIVVDVVAFDWNCSQHITPRWTEEEVRAVMGATQAGGLVSLDRQGGDEKPTYHYLLRSVSAFVLSPRTNGQLLPLFAGRLMILDNLNSIAFRRLEEGWIGVPPLQIG